MSCSLCPGYFSSRCVKDDTYNNDKSIYDITTMIGRKLMKFISMNNNIQQYSKNHIKVT